ncbi:prenyltransferase/squalene oxidase repeat-containing protein [Crateriforma conspicua]|uniref:Squalene cyclase C-terminal domain-containing protein n=1 Tax=Crateriforma conspicua TaxID=2527996 RepID=A0A5C5Y5P0_9PLAN|nr:hypothetical protein [Crateriforma conspicua]TWT69545.1 hypothetical protein Pan14r_18330 [Crateriforma conspicua]
MASYPSSYVPPSTSLPSAAVTGGEDEVIVAELVQPESLVDQTNEDDASKAGWLGFIRATPAWLVSTAVHVALLVALGLVTMTEPQKIINVLTAAVTDDRGPEIKEFVIEEVDVDVSTEMEVSADPPPALNEFEQVVESIALDVPTEAISVPIESFDLAANMAPAGDVLQSLQSMASQSLSSRGKDMREDMLRKYGGTPSSEAAVSAALKWLALHQAPNGGWTFNHASVCRGRCGNIGEPKYLRAYNAATALALLPFLGAGQTHYEGEYQQVVRKGLLFLIKNGRKGKIKGVNMLDFTEPGGRMYSHGLAAIALSEAYAMTQDPALAEPTQAALNFIVWAQGPDGGWRYQPNSPMGDTSVVGWQLMALKSGYMGHLVVPPQSISESVRYLNRVQGKNGAVYGYVAPPAPRMDDPTKLKISPACTAIGLLCRMYTGWQKGDPRLEAGVQELARIGVRRDNIYYDYYAAQVLRHHGGSEWQAFNEILRDWLVSTQSQDRGAKGSWHFPDSQSHKGPVEGGRLLSTAFATMILEVYYRHMPLYADAAAEEEFPL